MDKIKSSDNKNASYDARNWISHILTEYKMAKPLLKIIWQCIFILKMDLPYDLAIKLLDIHPQEMIAYFHAKTLYTEDFGSLLCSSQKV